MPVPTVSNQEEADKLIREWLASDPNNGVCLVGVWQRGNLRMIHIPGVSIEQIESFLKAGGLIPIEDRWPYDLHTNHP